MNEEIQAHGAGPNGAPREIPADSISERQLDQDALRVISRLVRHGHEAYLVGGCVRDLLIGRRPKDFDVATSAHPRQIKRLFRNGRIIGRRFKLVHIHYASHIIETATFRSDPFEREEGDEGEVQDLLIIEDNEFGTAEEDARRRDFTVNALFHDPTRERILDYVGGLDDLDARLLRTIGDPAVRIAEDPVRILRAVKFATRMGFRIEDATWDAMNELAPLLERSAPPRVLEEILRLLRSGTALGALRMLRDCGALTVVLPRIDAWLEEGGGEELWPRLEALDADVHAGYTPSTPVCIALLHQGLIEREADPERRTLPGPPRELPIVCAEVLDGLSAHARLSRRDSSRARRILVQQRRFTQTSSKRFRPLLFMRNEDFPEALDLFRLSAAARGTGWDIYEGWRTRYDDALAASPDEVDSERKKSRRRRRRRRRKGSPAGDGVRDDD
jgi:poly(A) polymerase